MRYKIYRENNGHAHDNERPNNFYSNSSVSPNSSPRQGHKNGAPTTIALRSPTNSPVRKRNFIHYLFLFSHSLNEPLPKLHHLHIKMEVVKEALQVGKEALQLITMRSIVRRKLLFLPLRIMLLLISILQTFMQMVLWAVRQKDHFIHTRVISHHLYLNICQIVLAQEIRYNVKEERLVHLEVIYWPL